MRGIDSSLPEGTIAQRMEGSPFGRIITVPLPDSPPARHDCPMYEHSQRSSAMLLLLLAASVVPTAILLLGSRAMPLGARITLGVTIVILLVTALVFSSLTIRVDDERLAWHFGPGVWKKSVPLDEIVDAMPTTTTFLEGWGIHLTGRGWLYNVAGREAVIVTMRDGTQFLLGTDEPQQLVHAIRPAQDRGGR